MTITADSYYFFLFYDIYMLREKLKYLFEYIEN